MLSGSEAASVAAARGASGQRCTASGTGSRTTGLTSSSSSSSPAAAGRVLECGGDYLAPLCAKIHGEPLEGIGLRIGERKLGGAEGPGSGGEVIATAERGNKQAFPSIADGLGFSTEGELDARDGREFEVVKGTSAGAGSIEAARQGRGSDAGGAASATPSTAATTSAASEATAAALLLAARRWRAARCLAECNEYTADSEAGEDRENREFVSGIHVSVDLGLSVSVTRSVAGLLAERDHGLGNELGHARAL
jgi:hypothetical protein